MVLRVGPLKSEDLWEVWVNITEPVSQAVVKVLAGQPNHLVHFVGDSGRVERSFQGPNTLASFAREVIAESKGRSSWSQSSFDQMRDRTCGQWPELMPLWAGLAASAPASAPAQPRWRAFGEAATGPQSAVPAETARESAASTYRGFHEDIRDLLICLAPFKGVVARGAMDELLEQLKQQPPLAQLALHRWKEALGLIWTRGLVRPHPAHPGFAVVAPEFGDTIRRRLDRFSPVEARLAIDAAFYLTYRAFAKRMFERFAVGCPGRGSRRRGR